MALRAHKAQPAKTAAIENITNELKASSSFIFTEYRGLSVEQITQLRAKLRENNCTYKVVRNNFARIAFSSMELDVKDYLVGPTAVALANEDANAVAKTLFEFVNCPVKKNLSRCSCLRLMQQPRSSCVPFRLLSIKKAAQLLLRHNGNYSSQASRAVFLSAV